MAAQETTPRRVKKASVNEQVTIIPNEARQRMDEDQMLALATQDIMKLMGLEVGDVHIIISDFISTDAYHWSLSDVIVVHCNLLAFIHI